MKKFITAAVIIVACLTVTAQEKKWAADGESYYAIEANGLTRTNLPDLKKTIILTEVGFGERLAIEDFEFAADGNSILLYTNSQKVWRENTRGDYYLYNITTKKTKQIAKGLPVAHTMFAKLSPDGKKVGYVSKHNIYAEDIATGKITQLTKDGTDRIINGTFDWAYEEEFFLRDGFRWSPDSRSIAYWQLDASKIKNFLMVNNTDSIYSFITPVEYPKVGQDPSAARVGVVNIATAKTIWIQIPGDKTQHYITALEYAGNSNEVVIEQLNRKQNERKLMLCNATTGLARIIYQEKDKAWIDASTVWDYTNPAQWYWLNNHKQFVWVSEKDGWRHLYMLSTDGKSETLITKGDYDVISIKNVDEKNGYVYFMASPDDATQSYLYRTKLNGTGAAELLSNANQKGKHKYTISPNAKYAQHSFSSIKTYPAAQWINLQTGESLSKTPPRSAPAIPNPPSLFKINIDGDVSLDGYMVRPENFDSTKKYPVLFYVYAEPGSATVSDSYGGLGNFLYPALSKDGYILISVDGRGTPVPKGAAWRKSVYGKVGILNVDDQAKAAREIMKWPFVDTSRIAVWGWSGGGSTTLNLMFKYPEIYKTGIAVAPVASRYTYDNIYEERYMGLPKDNPKGFEEGSAINHAAGLRGNLLVVHGTGDDNVHYQNTELLINKLVENNKQFQLMSYPNRTHNINEGKGTTLHLMGLFKNYLNEHCPGGGR